MYRELFWTVTHHDIKTKVKLYIAEKQALITQEFQSLYKVMEIALGDGKSNKQANTNVMVPKSGDELKQAFNKVFS